MDVRILSAADVSALLPMAKTIEAMRDAFAQLANNRVHVPLRTITEFDSPELKIFYKPCYSPETDNAGIKLLTQTKGGGSAPTIQGVNILIDAKTGCFLAITDGTYLTALRTGATSGLATDLLARKDAKTAAIFGAGAQGRTQLEAVCTIRDIKRAYIFDIDKNVVKNYIAEMQPRLDGTLLLHGTDLNLLREADVICTATGATKPLFSRNDIKDGVHINAVGSYNPHMQEIDGQIMKDSNVYVDQRSACLSETGDFIKPIKEGLFDEKHIVAELGELITGRSQGRQSEHAITLFKSVGIAVQDLVATHAVYQNALSQNKGMIVKI